MMMDNNNRRILLLDDHLTLRRVILDERQLNDIPPATASVLQRTVGTTVDWVLRSRGV